MVMMMVPAPVVVMEEKVAVPAPMVAMMTVAAPHLLHQPFLDNVRLRRERSSRYRHEESGRGDRGSPKRQFHEHLSTSPCQTAVHLPRGIEPSST